MEVLPEQPSGPSRLHVGALIAKGGRNFATPIDFEIERIVRAYLREQTPGIPFCRQLAGSYA